MIGPFVIKTIMLGAAVNLANLDGEDYNQYTNLT